MFLSLTPSSISSSALGEPGHVALANLTTSSAGTHWFAVVLADVFGCESCDVMLTVGTHLCLARSGQHNNPNSLSCRVDLEADTTYTVRMAYSMSAPPAVGVNFPNNTVTSLSADVASGLSYFFLVPPADVPAVKAGTTGFVSTLKDQLIGQYRNLTGQAPLYGRWSVGFVQYVLTLQ